MAARHGVAALVRSKLVEANAEVPASAERFLKELALANLAQNARLSGDVARLAVLLQGIGVPFLVLKGPVLVRTIYPAVALRPYTDIDLTIKPEHEHATVQALARHGYRESHDPNDEIRRERAASTDSWAPFHRRFSAPTTRSLVELHLDPLQLGLRPVCEAERWQRAQPMPDVPGAWMLCPEDNIVQLSLHVHKHGFDRLIWLKDIDLAVRAWGDRLDWGLVERVSRLEGVSASVWYTLGLTRQILGTPLSSATIARLRPSRPMRLLYRAVWPVQRIANLDAQMHRRAVQCELGESWRDMLPSLILMGRRRERARTLASALLASALPKRRSA